jgi:hypothetical protein
MARDHAKAPTWQATQARLTLLYAESDPGRLGRQSARLARYADYKGTLNSLLADGDASPFDLPWDKGWSNYWAWLLGSDYADSTVDALVKRVVPLRVKPSVDITVPDLPGPGLKVTAIRAEGFMYPHAAITAVTFELGGEATIPETADGITALAEAPVMVQGVETRLSQMAERVARHVRESCGFGVATAVSKSSRFRLFSVINGTGGTEAPAANAPEWAALQGISSLRRDWATIPPPSPGNILKLSFGTPKLAHFNKDAVSYILASNFATSPGKSNRSPRPSNSCYHRNQVLLAAHLFALIPLVRWARPHLVTHDTPVEVDRLAPAAASTIVDLRGRDAYRSALTTPLAALLDPDNEVGAVANAG